MEPIFSLLLFPQQYKSGKLNFNLMILPRNIDLRNPLAANLPSYYDSEFKFSIRIIDSLEGLPLHQDVSISTDPVILSKSVNKAQIIESVINQMEINDGLKISSDPVLNGDKGVAENVQRFGSGAVIRKYLPQSYREAFNFTNPRTRFATTDDGYYCSIKNKQVNQTDPVTHREYISWGKLVGFILRNHVLAEAAGFIQKAEISLPEKCFEKGGWIFAEFNDSSIHSGLSVNTYAARIPALNKDRRLFAPVLFPVGDSVFNNSTYDQVMQEAIIYNDGFAKIVHANQPVSQDLLQEKDSSNPPSKDIGLRLGWDDEQLAIWGNRQLTRKDEISNMDIDSPVGVFGYKIDVRKAGETDWRSQNMIAANQDTGVGTNEVIFKKSEPFELPTEVHPSSHGDTKNDGFWLPMYFSAWNGKCMAIPDSETEEIYRMNDERVIVKTHDNEDESNDDFEITDEDHQNAINIKPKQTFHPYSQVPKHRLDLRYGEDYQFRVRLSDISGGGPEVNDEMINGGQNPVADVHFRRNIAAQKVRLLNVEAPASDNPAVDSLDISILENILGNDNILKIKRPELSYPAVVYTGKYKDVVKKLNDKFNSLPQPDDPKNRPQYSVSLPDPDVNTIKIVVEIKSLEMDNLLSENGKESYIVWQEKIFELNSDKPNENYDLETQIRIVYQEFNEIEAGTSFVDNTKNQLILPYSRQLRISVIPVVDDADGDYAARFVKQGSPTVLRSFKMNPDEKDLLSPVDGGLRAYYLQPEKETPLSELSPKKYAVIVKQKNKTSAELKRLADELGLAAHNLTLEGKKGNRVQFGVSSKIQHTLSPEAGSVTLASVNEILNKWMVAVDLSMLRDWSWDGLKVQSFEIERQISIKKFGSNKYQIIESRKKIGSVRVHQTANMSMLKDPDRSHTRIMFIDAVSDKDLGLEFPEELIVEYNLKAKLKPNSAVVNPDLNFSSSIHLPVSTAPAQTPKIVSVGLAMSPYKYDEEAYTFSNERRKYLWLEFEEPPADPKDTYFARVMAYSPDPYLCRVDDDLIKNIDEDLPFNLKEEEIRKIIPGMDNDFGGVGLMQELIPESEENPKRFLLPLPEGLHHDSDELFGFFTYEIRLAHKKECWSTARARYSRPLRINGLQHPAPDLICNAFRSNESNDKSIVLTAYHANAVLKGKNITAFPPNTAIWYLLYTQVMQADGESYRNILIDSGPMFYKPKITKGIDGTTGYIRESGDRPGVAEIPVSIIRNKLKQLGLPANNSLSVIAVEMFPIDNQWQYVKNKWIQINDNYKFKKPQQMIDAEFISEYKAKTSGWGNPLTDFLGFYRIYRSSKLVPVGDICCIDC